MRLRLTKRTVEALAPGPRDSFAWDTELKGFGCKITPGGARIYVLQYSRANRDRRVTIGRHGVDLTLDQARREALRLRGLVASGADPAEERAIDRRSATLGEFAQRYLADYARPNKKPRSVEEDERNLRLHILPALGKLKLSEIGRAEIARFVQGLRRSPITANRCRALISTMFNLAEKWGLRPDGANPVRHIDKFPETKRQRFLSPAELARLGKVLKQAATAGEHPSVVAALRMLLLTGCRRNEILHLQWEHVDLTTGCLRLPESKTGAKVVPLGAPARELLASLPRKPGNPYVLPGTRPGAPYVALEKAWQKLRARAGLADVRLHDLRHSFASVGAAQGESLVVLGSLLGHSSPAMTARYAHLSDDPRLASADRIATGIAAALEGKRPVGPPQRQN